MTKSRKRAVYGGGVIVLLGAVAWGFSTLRGTSADVDESRIATVERGTMVRSVVATGRIEPITKVEIKSKANGIIKAIRVDVDRVVREGDILVELDRENIAARVRESRATLQGARAALEAAEAQLQKSRIEAEGPEVEFARRAYERARSLFDQRLIAQSTLDEASNALEQAQNRQRAAQSQLSIAKAGVAQAAANVARALKAAGRDARVSLVFPEANSFGAALLARGGLESAAAAVAAGARAVVAAEADVTRRADAATAGVLLQSHLISIDHTTTETSRGAEVVLPAATFAESSGTLVSTEGRAQRYFAAFPAEGAVRETWRWAADLAAAAGRPKRWENLDQVIEAIEAQVPELRGIGKAAPGGAFRVHGLRIPRKSHRESGRTAVNAHLDMHEPRPAQDPDTPLSYSMEGLRGEPPAALIPRFWAPGWNSDQSINKFQIEVGGHLRGGDPGFRIAEPRIAEPGGGPSGGYHREIPRRPAAAAGNGLLLVPAHHVFGSEELSSLAAGIAQRAPRPYIALSRPDCERLGLREGAEARVSLDGAGADATLSVVVKDLAPGVAAVPVGLRGPTSTGLPARARIEGGGR